MAHQYKDPINGRESSIGPQIVTAYYQRKALEELRKEQFFTQLATATAIPSNFGKTIKRFHYMPILDDRNVNDEGIDATGAKIVNGNLYGSSKDIGTVPGKLPVLGENGGRVNRVGVTRLELEGTFEKFGFFTEYTRDSLNFDTDADLLMHINRELLTAANQITEDALGIDLINNAGTIRYAGDATSRAEIGQGDIVTYTDLMRLSIDLDNNRTPKHTTILTGTRNIDTRVVPAARYAYIGSELIPTLRAMVDLHGNPAFISAEHYAAGTTLATGEVGQIDQFRFIVNPNMFKWEGAGATLETGDDAVYYNNGENYDVFPILVVGDESFATITFQTSGNTVKFEINHKKPGDNLDRLDPYGETGFISIRWFYGFMALRPERIALVMTAAKM
ncbi:major capsid protein [Kosakonia phage Kc283]|uniref:Major capsid protein n=1 Tax=Kosakonia phage Kc283 TaxID=2863195 RepID=A0AAE7WF36_9CAUD|nr:major head protein [Kosakonia phage Kc283]QYN79877.1 major capsid protein [Kosakonia phage Kc283]